MREKPEQQIRDRRVRAVADAQRHHLSRFDDRRRLAAVVEELAADNLHGARSGCRLLPIAGPHVLLDDLEARPLRTHTALEIDGAFAQVRDRLQVVRDEHDRDALALERVHPLDAPLLKRHVADGQHLVDEKHVWIEMRRDRETEARVHP